MLKFPLSDQYPAVVRLSVHKEGEQIVYFTNEAQAKHKVLDSTPPTSTLLEYFRLCRQDAVGLNGVKARDVLYVDIVKYFRWNQRRFQPRERDIPSVGRIYYTGITEGNRYFLHLLLNNVKGPYSEKHLRTVDGVTYPTCRAAAEKLGLLFSDEHHRNSLLEASTWATAGQLRELFSIILVHSSPSNPELLWREFQADLTEDLSYQWEKIRKEQPDNFVVINYGLYLMQNLVIDMGTDLKGVGLPMFDHVVLSKLPHGVYNQPIDLHEQKEKSLTIVQEQLPMLNSAQRDFYDFVTKGVNLSLMDRSASSQFLTFLDGPGGTGKTFLLNFIIHSYISQSKVVIAASSAGVSALLLHNGSTAHSAFGIPLSVDDSSVCSLSGRDSKSILLMKADLIIWDKISMQHKYCMEAVDRSLQHIRRRKQPFGGISVIFAGDFRQTLPIVPGGTMYDQRAACLKSSYLWLSLKTFRLYDNLRLREGLGPNGALTKEYGKWLLRLGNGDLHSSNMGSVSLENISVDIIPPFTTNPHTILEWIYDGFVDLVINKRWDSLVTYYGSRCLITPLNKTVDNANAIMLSKIPGEAFISTSIDEADDEFEDPMSTDVLNAFDTKGFPLHRLLLKVGQPIMVIRNLSVAKGLCNGTRLIILSISSHLLRCKVLTGAQTGNVVAIPRVKLIHQGDREFPIVFSRVQFPVKAAFCLTINKSQGQSLDKVAVLLSGPVFAHGQLYVALSRCTKLSNLRVCLYTSLSRPVTTNVVCKQVLKD